MSKSYKVNSPNAKALENKIFRHRVKRSAKLYRRAKRVEELHAA